MRSQIQRRPFGGVAPVLLLIGVAIGQTPVVPSAPTLVTEFPVLRPVVSRGKIGFIDSSANLVIPYRFDYVAKFSEGLAYFLEEGRSGYVDTTGKVVFDEARFSSGVRFDFSEGLAGFEFATRRKGNNYLRHRLRGYRDRTGKIVIPPRFFNASDFHEGLAAVNEKLNAKWGYIDKIGNYVIPPTFDYASDFSEGMAAVAVDQRCGYIDHAGKVVIRPFINYEYGCGRFREGVALVGRNDFGLIDTSGHYVIPPQHATAWPTMREGLIWSPWTSPQGFYDKYGKLVIDTSCYSDARAFSEGLAAVKKGKYGYINKKGELVIPLQFDAALDFVDGLAMVGTHEGWVYIDKSSKVVWKGASF